MRFVRMRLLVASFWIRLIAAAAPVAIPVQDPGFESFTGSDPAHFGSDGFLIPFHFSQSPSAVFDSRAAVVADPVPGWGLEGDGGVLSAVPVLSQQPVQGGRNWGFLRKGAAIRQAINATYSRDTLYRFRAQITSQPGLVQSYSMSLVSGTNVLAKTTGMVLAGVFTATELTLIVPSDSPFLGKTIEILLRNESANLGTYYLDDVQLSQESVPPSVPPSSAAIGWWPADSEANVITGGTGFFRSTGKFGPGFIGNGMVFTGGASGFVLPNEFAIPGQEFTVEAWVQRGSTQAASTDGGGGQIFGGSSGGFSFGITDDGRLYLSHVGIVSFFSDTAVRDSGWHHLALSRVGGSIKFYVDGVLKSTLACDVRFSLSGPYAIGGLGGGYLGVYYGFVGNIDELSVYGRPLTDAEIFGIFQSNVSGKSPRGFKFGAAPSPAGITLPEPGIFRSGVTNTGTTAVQNLRLVQTLPSDAVIRSAVSTGGGVVSIEGSVAALAVPILEPGGVVVLDVAVDGELIGSAFLTNRLSVTLEQDGQSYSVGPLLRVSRVIGRSVLVPRGLVSWWPGEGTPLDAWGSAQGVLSGHTKFDAGLVGRAFSLDGTDSSIQLGPTSSLGLNEITIETWVKRSSAISPSPVGPGTGALFGGGIGSYTLAMMADGRLTFSEVGVTKIDSTLAVTDTDWHHVAVTRAGASVRFYIDGADAGSGSYPVVFNFDSPFAIGALGQSVPGVGVETFAGRIDELSIYNRALSADEIFSIYRAYSNGKTTGSVDLSALVTSSQPAVLGSPVEYQYSVLNNTVGPISELILDQPVPAGWAAPALTPSRGSASMVGAGIRWNLGTLEAGARATLLISIKPSEAGTATLVGALSGWSGGVRTKSVALTTVAQPVVVTLPNLSVVAPRNAVVPAVGTNLLQFDLALDVASTTAVFVDYGIYPIFRAGGRGFDATFGTAVIPAGTLRSGIPIPLLAGTTTDLGSLVLMISGIRGAAGPTTTFLAVQAPYSSDLKLSTAEINAAVPAGGTVVGRWRLENRGTGAAIAAGVVIPVPAGWKVKGLLPTQGVAELSDQGIGWSVGQLNPEGRVELEVSFQPSLAGSGQILASATTASTDADGANNQVSSLYHVEFLPNLTAGADVSGTAPASGKFTVPVEFRLSAPAPSAVQFSVNTVDGTAVAGRDYASIHSTVTIPAGSSSAEVQVELLAGNPVIEDLGFQVVASSVSGAVLIRDTVAVRVSHLVLSDLMVSGSVSDGVSTIPDPVHLSFAIDNQGPVQASDVTGVLPVPTGWRVAASVGSLGTVQVSDGSLRWNVGSLAAGARATLDLDVAAVATGAGEFTLTLSSSTPDPIGKNNQTSLIARTEAPVFVSLAADQSVGVPIGASQVLPVEVRLSGPSSHEVKATYFFAQGTALLGRDFNASSGVITFSPGTVVQTIPVTLLPNADAGTDSRFEIRLVNSSGAELARGSSTITLRGVSTQTGIARLSTGELRIRVHVIPGRNYQLQRSDAFDTGIWAPVGDGYASNEEADHEFTDPLPIDSNRMFYRVVVTSR